MQGRDFCLRHPQPQTADLCRQNARRRVTVVPAVAGLRFARALGGPDGAVCFRRRFRRRFRGGRFRRTGVRGGGRFGAVRAAHGQRDGDGQHRARGQRRDGQPARLPPDVGGLFDHAVAQVSDAAEQVFRRHTAIPSFKSASRSPARRRNSRDLTVFSVRPNRPDKRRTESP